jgi:chromosome segregation ATPase
LARSYSDQYALRDEIYELRNSLCSANSTLLQLAAALHALEERLAHLWYRSEQHVAHLEGHLNVVSAAWRDATEKWASALDVAEVAARAADASKMDLESCRAERDAAHRRLHHLEESLAEEKRHMETARDDAAKMSRQLEDLTRRAASAEEALAGACTQMDKETARTANLSAEVTALTQQLAEATRRAEAQEAEDAARAAAAAGEAAVLQRRLGAVEEERMSLQQLAQKDLAAWDEERRRLEGQLRKLASEAEELRSAAGSSDEALRHAKVAPDYCVAVVGGCRQL